METPNDPDRLFLPGESPESQALVPSNRQASRGEAPPYGAPDGAQAPPVDEASVAYPVPAKEAFELAESDFIPAPDIERLAADLFERYPEDFQFILEWNFQIIYFWKQKGGSSGGKLRLGRCMKPSGLIRHYAQSDFIIWIGADNCEGRLNRKQMEALVFHELKHIGADEKNQPILRPHDFQGFAREIEEFGAWKTEIERIAKAVRVGVAPPDQPDLFS